MTILPYSVNTAISKAINPGAQVHPAKTKANVVESFGDTFTSALGKVNNLQVQSDKMVQKMITQPGKVNIHEVTTLLSQAEMSLSMTKAITDRVVTAYREITNLR